MLFEQSELANKVKLRHVAPLKLRPGARCCIDLALENLDFFWKRNSAFFHKGNRGLDIVRQKLSNSPIKKRHLAGSKTVSPKCE